jgi:O-antigen/teichoic acid export membrane protein
MKDITKSAILLVCLNVLSGGLGYLIRFLFARNLSVEEYGAFYAVYTIFFFFAPFRDLGLSEAGVFFINKYRVKNNLIRIKQILLTCIYSQLFVTIVLFLLLNFFRNFLILHYFKTGVSGIMFSIIGIIFVMDFFFPIISSFFMAYEKAVYYKLSDIVKSIIILVSAFLFFHSNFIQRGLIPAVAFLLGALCSFLIMAFIFCIKFYYILKQKTKFEASVKKELFKYSLPILLSVGAIMLITYSDTILLTLLSSVRDVGLYNVAYPAAFMIMLFASPVTMLLFPRVSSLFHSKQSKSIKFILDFVYSNFLIFLLPVVLMFFIYSDFIINIFFSSNYIGANIPFKIFSIGAIFMFLWDLNAYVMIATGQAKSRMKLIAVVGILNVVFGIIFISLFGVIGASLSTILSFICMVALSSKHIFRKYKVSIDFVEQIKIIVCSLIFLASIYLFRYVINVNVYLEIILVFGISGLVYLLSLFLLGVVNKKKIDLFRRLFF